VVELSAESGQQHALTIRFPPDVMANELKTDDLEVNFGSRMSDLVRQVEPYGIDVALQYIDAAADALAA
jgi:hypothetical protein